MPDLTGKPSGENRKRGNLKIFFGYAPGVGKTYTMLRSALSASRNGVDVVIGYIDPHTMPETLELSEQLEQLSNGRGKSTVQKSEEFDVDAAISRRPQLILVDELAHMNKKGCRHKWRYQDIEELLKAGLDVYTTVNEQNIESLHDIASETMNAPVEEKIPDFVFDQAEQVELIDMEPEELIERLNQGTYDKQIQEGLLAASYFSIENLTSLRERALRRCADRINHLSKHEKMEISGEGHTKEHILACLSVSPSNEKIVRTAARMAHAFHGMFTALFVKTPEFAQMDEESRKRLQDNMHLAEQLGAKIEVIYSDDIPFQIAEFARLSDVSKVVMGRSAAARTRLPRKNALTERLIANAPNLDVYIIPDTDTKTAMYHAKRTGKSSLVFSYRDLFKSTAFLFAASLIGWFFDKMGSDNANIVTVYVLSVFLISIVTKNRIYSLISSIVSVLVFNFLFTDPRFSLEVCDAGSILTFVVMFSASFLTGLLVIRLKNSARQSAGVALRTRILFDTNRLLQQAKGREDIILVTVSQLKKLLERDIVVYMADKGKMGEPKVFSHKGELPREKYEVYISERERQAALWTFKNNKHAGATTNTFPDAECLYLAVRVNDNVYGVIGIVMEKTSLEAFESSILLSVLGECALALENEKNMREKEEAAVLAQNEKLRANLLRAISHDLRTPLTSISGNASNLLSMGSEFDEETRRQLYTDIYEDSMWLFNLVENLLSITRLVEGRLNLNITDDLIEDVIAEALLHVSKKRSEHHITVKNQEEFILARMDSRLIVQVMINLINNAIEYTPKGSHIQISVKRQEKKAVVSISDDGNGISDEAKAKVFDMFYSGENKIADSRRNCGIGLSLCKSIIEAHGGEISVADNKPHGAVFTFTLPAEEVRMYE